MFRAIPSILCAVLQLRSKETPDHASRFRKPPFPFHPAVNIYNVHITLMEENSNIYENLKLEYPVLWTGMKSFPAEGRDKCAMYCT